MSDRAKKKAAKTAKKADKAEAKGEKKAAKTAKKADKAEAKGKKKAAKTAKKADKAGPKAAEKKIRAERRHELRVKRLDPEVQKEKTKRTKAAWEGIGKVAGAAASVLVAGDIVDAIDDDS